MTAPHRRPATAPPTVRDLLDAFDRAADRGITVQIATLPDDALVADLDGVLYIDPDQDAGAAAVKVADALDDMCAEVDRPRRHLAAVREAGCVRAAGEQRRVAVG